ncbi:hypothetical protein VP01_7425g1, partial [Puccinia sorghi]
MQHHSVDPLNPPRVPITPNPGTAVYIDYSVFIWKLIDNTRPSSSNSTSAPTKDWEKISPSDGNVLWMTKNTNLAMLDKACLLKFQCTLWMHCTYGVNKNYLFNWDAEFEPFKSAVVVSPANTIKLIITMDDPDKQ